MRACVVITLTVFLSAASAFAQLINDDNGNDDVYGKAKAVPLHAMEALGGRGNIDATHSLPRQ
jgi:ribosomal protein L18